MVAARRSRGVEARRARFDRAGGSPAREREGDAARPHARRVPPLDPGESHYHRAEIFFGEFRRSIELPWNADDQSIVARYRDGMLEIEVEPVRSSRTTQITVERKS